MTDADGDAERPTDDEPDNIYARVESGHASEEEVARYNEMRQREIDETLAQLSESKQKAVAALRDSATDTVETEPVTLGDVELAVKTRIPPEVERLVDRIQQAESDQDRHRARRLNAEALSEMVADPDEYADPEVWVVAAEQNGMHWLGEVTDRILAPAKASAEELRDDPNSQPASDSTPGQTKARQSGLHREP